ncbi:MAG: polysaccharide deacetylase family protein [Planctomycetota bacterium]
MSIKHRLKGVARGTFSRVVWYTGLHRLFDRVCERRLLILYGHCVDQPATNGSLDADMKISGERLERILRALGRRYDLVAVGEGAERLETDPMTDPSSRAASSSLVALSMDDGYRDNLHDLVPLLERVGGRSTVFLEGGAVAERRLPWLHALGWLQRRLGPEALAERLAAALPDQRSDLLDQPGSANRQKRILKYDAPRVERDAVLRDLVASEGGDPGRIVDELYLSAGEARELGVASAIEIGGHTVNHPVLSRLSKDEQREEIQGGRDAIDRVLGEDAPSQAVFAYPYGRRWDFDQTSPLLVQEAGYSYAVTTHAGVNRRGTPPYLLRRWPIHDGTKLHEVATEACGAFEWLRGLGVNLVE